MSRQAWKASASSTGFPGVWSFVRGAALTGTGLLIAVAVAGCNRPGARGGPPPGGPAEVAVVTLQPEAVTLSEELPGLVSAFLVAEVRPQVSGIIQNRLFEEGANVKAGDVLYQIDPAVYEAAHTAAKAALARAEANRTAIRLKAERYKDLVAVNAVSRQNYDDISAALTQSEAEVEVAKAALDAARINLNYTRITAPISGRIGRSAVTIGALATAYQPMAFAVIQQLDPVYVDVPQASASLLRMKEALSAGGIVRDDSVLARVALRLESGTPYPLDGQLKFADVTVDPSTASVSLRLVFPNPDGTLLPGMFVRARINEGVREQAILVPQQGISRDPKGNPYVLLVDAEGKAQHRTVTLDRAMGNRWLVTSGLAAGDRVIVEGVQRVRPGAPVQAVAWTPEPAPGAPPAAAPHPAPQSK